MSDRGSFLGGFLFGTIVGGVIGGVVGAITTAHVNKHQDEPDAVSLLATTEEDMEIARRGVEEKIAQLNHAIDDVRQQLGAIPRHSSAAASSSQDHEA